MGAQFCEALPDTAAEIIADYAIEPSPLFTTDQKNPVKGRAVYRSPRGAFDDYNNGRGPKFFRGCPRYKGIRIEGLKSVGDLIKAKCSEHFCRPGWDDFRELETLV